MLGKIWGIALLVLGIYVAVEVSRNPMFQETPPKKQSANHGAAKDKPAAEAQKVAESKKPDASEYELIPKTPEEIAETLVDLCDQMQAEIKAAKIPVLFSKLHLQFREKRLATAFFKNQLGQCFRQSDLSKNTVEIEVFSSDFAGEKADHQIQLQASVLEANKNKIFEVARMFEMKKKIVKLTPSANQ